MEMVKKKYFWEEIFQIQKVSPSCIIDIAVHEKYLDSV